MAGNVLHEADRKGPEPASIAGSVHGSQSIKQVVDEVLLDRPYYPCR